MGSGLPVEAGLDDPVAVIAVSDAGDQSSPPAATGLVLLPAHVRSRAAAAAAAPTRGVLDPSRVSC